MMRKFLRPFSPKALILLTALGIAGCVETVASVKPEPSAPRIAARPGISPGGASVAMTGLIGPPQAVSDRFSEAFAREAAGREIKLSDSKSANYLVKGYLSAYTATGGTALAYVWDVFDARKNRTQRVNDLIIVQGSSADPWALADEKALASLAAKSADDLAAFLTNTPEAVAAAGKPQPAAVATAVDEGVSSVAQSAKPTPAIRPAATGLAAAR